MTTKAKVIHILGIGLKIFGAIILLYFFICSLDLLANAFRLSSGKTAGGFKRKLVFQTENTIVNVFILKVKFFSRVN